MQKNTIITLVVIALIIVGLGIWHWKTTTDNTTVTPSQTTQDNSTPTTNPDVTVQTEPQPDTTTTNNNTTNNLPAQAGKTFMIQDMKVDVLKEGSGEAAKKGDLVTVNYTGTLTDGTKFDSSLNPGRTPFQFTLGQNRVIQGWELGVLGMKAGEKRKLTIPSDLGYGPGGNPPVIPGGATLLFDVELLKIN